MRVTNTEEGGRSEVKRHIVLVLKNGPPRPPTRDIPIYKESKMEEGGGDSSALPPNASEPKMEEGGGDTSALLPPTAPEPKMVEAGSDTSALKQAFLHWRLVDMQEAERAKKEGRKLAAFAAALKSAADREVYAICLSNLTRRKMKRKRQELVVAREAYDVKMSKKRERAEDSFSFYIPQLAMLYTSDDDAFSMEYIPKAGGRDKKSTSTNTKRRKVDDSA